MAQDGDNDEGTEQEHRAGYDRHDGHCRKLNGPTDGGGEPRHNFNWQHYCEGLVRQPLKTHLILISDLAEGGDRDQLLARAASLVESGANLIVLLARSDDGRTWRDEANARAFAALGCPVFACTPDQFPELMAAALRRQDVGGWAASVISRWCGDS